MKTGKIHKIQKINSMLINNSRSKRIEMGNQKALCHGRQQKYNISILKGYYKVLSTHYEVTHTHYKGITTKYSVLRGKLLMVNICIKKGKRSQIGLLSLHLKKQENKEQTEAKRRTKIIKLGADINEIETSKTIEKIHEIKNEFFENRTKLPIL